jgi:RNA polymerase sigma-54 factor
MLKQSLQLKLLQKLSPQQIQLMKLLQVPTIALEQRIKEEMMDNPALEEGVDEDGDNEFEEEVQEEFDEDKDDFNDETEAGIQSNEELVDLDDYYQEEEDVPYYKLNVNNSSPDDEKNEIPITINSSFHENLISQLSTCKLNEKQVQITNYMIGNLDDDGYLRRPLANIVDDLAFSQNIFTTEDELEDALKVIQSFDPLGVGARTLQECLLIQLLRKEDHLKAVQNARIIIARHMDEFSKKHYDKIAKHLALSDDDLKDAIHEILHLNPRPGDSMSDSQKSQVHVVPDFIITNNEGVLELALHSKNAPPLRISKDYAEMLANFQKKQKEKKSKADREASTFIKQKIDSAKWFIDALTQRQQTLYSTMWAILEYQYEYFWEGDETKLKPMILKDIAERVSLDISTVSRVANSKYVQTPFGTILLKNLFSEAMHTDTGEEVSSREVKKILLDSISAEDKLKPITDDALAQLLHDKGYEIARRTVAKYREQLNIPVARLRKEL